MRGLLQSARRKAQGATGFKEQEFGPGRRLAARRKAQGARCNRFKNIGRFKLRWEA